ncbi:glycoside hydrolase family 16 protein [Hypoxylon sp. FL1284]|nr:glycoside hydrolase family 16 protein [Hypoxylon sp. FL1284]
MGWENSGAAPKGGPASFQVRDAGGPVELVNGPPPYYSAEPQLAYGADPQYSPQPQRANYAQPKAPWWNPRSWRKRTWAIVAAILIAIIVIAIVAPVEVAKANRYPDYSPLNYTLSDEYTGTGFFDKFDYFTGYDPASGFVHYVPREQAQQLNLTYTTADSAVLKVDTSVGPGSNPDASTGRFSVRVESKTQYNKGLFIFDVKHTPFGCGTWPALWLVDANNWPQNGEIDVMEAVNQAADGNQMTLHTADGCKMDVKRIMSGSTLTGDCYNATDDNAGCGVSGAHDSFGSGYNDAAGGITAMEWRDEGIRVWEFARNAVPADIAARNPDPSTWGEATADFPDTNCDIGSHFRNQSIVVNIDLCGQWAGNVYASSGCPSNCTDYVANNPTAFTNAFWEFGGFEVYTAS